MPIIVRFSLIIALTLSVLTVVPMIAPTSGATWTDFDSIYL